MAVDSKQKRESAFGINLSFGRVLPTPDGSGADSEDERAHLVFNYNGIGTSAATFQAAWALGSNVLIVQGAQV